MRDSLPNPRLLTAKYGGLQGCYWAAYSGLFSFAAAFLKEYDGVSPIHVQKFLQPGVAFYAEKFGREFKTGDQLSALLRKGDTGYVLVQRKMVEKLPLQDQQKLVEVAAVADKLLMRIR